VYAGLSYSRDDENQRKGMAAVFYLVDDEYEPEKIDKIWELNQHCGRLVASMPVSFGVTHFCYDSTSWRSCTSTYRMSVDSFIRLRTMVSDFCDHHRISQRLRPPSRLILLILLTSVGAYRRPQGRTFFVANTWYSDFGISDHRGWYSPTSLVSRILDQTSSP